MDRQDVLNAAAGFCNDSPMNFIGEEIALSPELNGMRIFEAPLIAYGDAKDPLFSRLKEPEIAGEWYMVSEEWLPCAKTVASFFFPFTDTVRKSNRKDMSWPSLEWLHGRIEGEAFLEAFALYMREFLINAGYQTVAPNIDERIMIKIPEFRSNWSERHTAFVCGLGTFGLSKGIITEKGMAGRLCSLITELYIEPDVRNYTEIYENCTNCGVCVRNCPAKAISLETGKDHVKCKRFIDRTFAKHRPRFGCGKCQIAVPCERRNPRANLRQR